MAVNKPEIQTSDHVAAESGHACKCTDMWYVRVTLAIIIVCIFEINIMLHTACMHAIPITEILVGIHTRACAVSKPEMGGSTRSVGDINTYQNSFAFIISAETCFWLKRVSDHPSFALS